MKKLKHISLAIFCCYILAVVLLCLIRTESLPELQKTFLGIPLDKVAHFMMFIPFPLLGYMSFHSERKEIWRTMAVLGILCILGVGFAFATERLQAMTTYRSCEPADMVADMTGIVSGAVVAAVTVFIRHR